MSRITLFLVAITGLCMVACSNNSSIESRGQESDTTFDDIREQPQKDETATVPTFPHLFTFIRQQDSSFSYTEFKPWQTDKDTTRPLPLSAGQVQAFRPYLAYNTDSTMAIDAVSYNFVLHRKNGHEQLTQAGPDSEVALINFGNNTRKRLLFLGTMGMVLDVRWQDPATILIAGAEESGETIVPLLWKYTITTGSLQSFRYNGTVAAQVGTYAEDRLNKKAKTSRAF